MCLLALSPVLFHGKPGPASPSSALQTPRSRCVRETAEDISDRFAGRIVIASHQQPCKIVLPGGPLAVQQCDSRTEFRQAIAAAIEPLRDPVTRVREQTALDDPKVRSEGLPADGLSERRLLFAAIRAHRKGPIATYFAGGRDPLPGASVRRTVHRQPRIVVHRDERTGDGDRMRERLFVEHGVVRNRHVQRGPSARVFFHQHALGIDARPVRYRLRVTRQRDAAVHQVGDPVLDRGHVLVEASRNREPQSACRLMLADDARRLRGLRPPPGPASRHFLAPVRPGRALRA